MPKHGRTKLVPQSMELPGEQSIEVTEEPSFLEQRELNYNYIGTFINFL
jgi:hypothetical protein